MDRRTFPLAGAAAVALPLARAQSFLSRPISLYCAFPAGGPTDQVFRAPAEAAARELKAPVIVENPEKINDGSTGTGTSPHPAVEEVAADAGGKAESCAVQG